MTAHNRRKEDKRDIWTAIPYDPGDRSDGQDGPYVTVETQDGNCMGFRFFPERVGKFIAYMETHYHDAWVTKEYSRRYMNSLRRKS